MPLTQPCNHYVSHPEFSPPALPSDPFTRKRANLCMMRAHARAACPPARPPRSTEADTGIDTLPRRLCTLQLVVATGVGNHQMMSCQFIRWTTPRSIVTSGSLGTMGFGLPAAIGAQVANPDKTVLLVDGDGSFNMTLNDLGTVKEHQLPIKMAIMNDGKQQMVQVWQTLFFDGRLVATDNVNPDYVALAHS